MGPVLWATRLTLPYRQFNVAAWSMILPKVGLYALLIVSFTVNVCKSREDLYFKVRTLHDRPEGESMLHLYTAALLSLRNASTPTFEYHAPR